ncbi:TlpA disulfide reductase family protein [Bacteroides sp. 224]|uniref:TlpA disulfide reductase family protein n=1 Tax=Bacteroides sp. 224 TaxID=2302936 RepID=UPI0013D0D316|nr:TlpA disulfide reductase family protein [Bacteroides sp. 224]NDV64117.1 AhpC/TSA family protein [Bacteroides sp. 224]
MKRLYTLLITAISLFGCSKTPDTVSIEGTINGINKDTLLLYANDELGNFIEKIPVKDGKFSYTMPMDTLLQTMLVLDYQNEYPIYLNKGGKIEIKGDLNISPIPEVKGNSQNEELTGFYQSLAPINEQPDSLIERKAEEFIRTHKASLPSIYLLDKYFIQKDSFDTKKIKELISVLYGELQDKPYIGKIKALIDETEKSVLLSTAPNFTLTDSEGEKINRYGYRGKVLLLSFWATWCDSCKTSNAELRQLYKSYTKKGKNKQKELDDKLAMVGISLDLDKTAWKETIKADTLEWQQVCDFEGWDNSAVKSYSITTIPYNILISVEGNVIARGIQGEELTQKIKELVEIERKKEEEREKAKKKSKK